MAHTGTATMRRVATMTAVALLAVGMSTWQAPPAAADSPVTATVVRAGVNHACAVLSNGDVKCWGNGASGALGLGNTAGRGSGAGQMGDNLPVVDLGAGRTATDLTLGWSSTCALLDNGQVKCWGFNGYGELGQGDRTTRGDGPDEMGDALPPIDLGTGRTATAVSANKEGTRCALLDNAKIKCWGSDGGGGLLGRSASGEQSIGDEPGEMGNNLPYVDLGTGRTALAVSVGNASVCALLDNHQVKCWGRGGYLGSGDTQAHGSGFGPMGDGLPAVDLGTGRTATAVSAGFRHTCAVLDNHQIKCWGYGYMGALGDGTETTRGDEPGEMGNNLPAVDLGAGRAVTPPADPSDPSPVTAAMENSFTCAVLDDAQVKCWGGSGNGQLGSGAAGGAHDLGDEPGEMGDALPTVDLGAGRTATNISSGSASTCALLDNGRIKCWGDNGSGRLGLGDTSDRGDAAGEMGDNLPYVDLGTHRDRLVDGEIKRSTDSSYAGAGTYNTTGAGQTAANDVLRGGSATFDVRFTNRSTGVDSMTVHGEGTVSNFPVTYRVSATDVTSQVVAGTYQFSGVPAGATVNLTMQLGVGAGAAAGSSRTVHLRGTSTNDPTKSDTIGATVTAVDPPPVFQVDGEVRRSTAAAFVGGNIYNTNGLNQKVKTDVRRRNTGTFDVRFTNRSTVADGITVHGPASSTGFKVRYFDGAAEVTSQVVAGTYTFPNVAAGGFVELEVKIKVRAGAPRGATQTALVTATSTHDASKIDAVKAKVRALA